MPELPEVETTVAGLRSVLEGHVLIHVEPRRPDLRVPFPPDLRQRMTGARVERLGRRAKYGLVETNRGDVMIFHLGMSGRWRVDPEDVGKHDHLVLHTDEGRRLALCDPRRFGFVVLVRADALESYPPFTRMGPEPLSDAFTGAVLKAALNGKATPIKAALLDQRVVAGLGNIYVCEALHMSGITPSRMAGKISAERCDRLVAAIKAVGHRGGRVDPARLCAARRAARLFREGMAGVRAGGRGVRHLRRDRPAPGRGRAQHLLLRRVSAITGIPCCGGAPYPIALEIL